MQLSNRAGLLTLSPRSTRVPRSSIQLPVLHPRDSPCHCTAGCTQSASSQVGTACSQAVSAPPPTAHLSHQHMQLHKTASLSRVLLIGQSSTVFRTFTQRGMLRVSGPVSLLLFLFSLVMAVVAAIRNALIQRVKECRSCHGFGVVRCRLCNGDGVVSWRAKYSYSDICPLCSSKRLVQCPDCGGHHQRVLFKHVPFQGVQHAGSRVTESGPKLSADWS